MIAWANDVFSFEKERQASDPINLVSVLAAEQHLTDAAALAAARDLYHGELAGLTRLVATARYRSPGLHAYVEGVLDCVYGSLAWSEGCQRYALSRRTSAA